MADEMTRIQATQQEAKAARPGLFASALRAVKGDDTHQLIEQFTDEVTLVTEGLCEDQARLRGEIADTRRELDRGVQRLQSRLEASETELEEFRRDADRRFDDIIKRLTALEIREGERTRAEEKLLAEKDKKKTAKGPNEGILRQITVIAGIIGGSAVIIAVLNLIRALIS